MRPEDARAIAAHVLNFFGFNERIIDNVLEPDDRDTFYMLEDTGILETERDETTLYDGREWRIHYWMFRKDRIFDLAREETQAMAEAGETDVVYSANAATLRRVPAPPRGARAPASPPTPSTTSSATRSGSSAETPPSPGAPSRPVGHAGSQASRIDPDEGSEPLRRAPANRLNPPAEPWARATDSSSWSTGPRSGARSR